MDCGKYWLFIFIIVPAQFIHDKVFSVTHQPYRQEGCGVDSDFYGFFPRAVVTRQLIMRLVFVEAGLLGFQRFESRRATEENTGEFIHVQPGTDDFSMTSRASKST